ncbi:MAG: NAD(P)H-dependent oxidoreductase [Holophagales bacterium]|nr:NAD(P)H-dependent oxidoreductase [Holophagales bacterium]
MNRPRILAFAGSTRKDSFNRKLVAIAAEGARNAGAEVELIDLVDLPMPLYDQDLEAAEGLPENAKRFKELLVRHQGMLIASPEYNSSIPPLLKNAIDWASRKEAGDPTPLVAYRDKIAGLLAASPGRLGGLRGLTHLRSILQNIGVMVLPDQMAVGQAHTAFDPDATLKDTRQHARVEEIGERLARLASRLES